ncbi:MAG TPA: hypothetical protein VGD57_07345 [Candidatus Dormibacteraeota bacterium]
MTTRAGSNNGASPNGSPVNIPDRLMRGENVASRSRDDIDHWLGAYTELLTFKDGLLRDMETGMQALSRTASAEIQELDVNLIVAQRARYLRRLEFWKVRKAEGGTAV